ncbi:hypothetical protein DYB32_006098 [Aphanomyces invadans]|nr:hypothetical protein DYB32_006098 [Aphanomyces invadans]
MCLPKDRSPNNGSAAAAYACTSIGTPFAITHDFHVSYNFELARFEIQGDRPHPPEFASQLVNWNMHQHFNVPIQQIPRVALPPYEDRIPAVLLMLQHQFNTHNGHVVPYIFRESPGKADRDRAIQAINSGTFSGEDISDVRIVADLIKVWFRELPIPLLHQIPLTVMEQINATSGDCPNMVDCMGTMELSILQWLADLLLHVASFEHINHMGIDQLAIILAPNLIRIDTPNPMVAVSLSKASVDFLRRYLKHRDASVNPSTNLPPAV